MQRMAEFMKQGSGIVITQQRGFPLGRFSEITNVMD